MQKAWLHSGEIAADCHMRPVLEEEAIQMRGQ